MGQANFLKLGLKKVFLLSVVLLLSSTVVFAQEDEESTNQQFEGFNLEGYTDGGEKAWEVNGDRADIDGTDIIISNVDANTFGDDKMNLKAKKGTINKESGDIFLERDVVITSESGAQMVTDTLDWYRNDDLVETDDVVTITREAMNATGTGMVAHPDLKQATLNQDVTVNVNPEPEQEESKYITITCDGPLEVDQLKNMATFQDNVVAIQEDRELKADRAELYFDPETNQIDRLVCIGNVEVTQGENKSFSQKAVYTASDQKLIMYGRPKIIMVTEGEGGIGTLK